MKNLSLVCGSRISVIEFYKRIKSLEVNFLSGNTNPLTLSLQNNTQITNLKLRPAVIFDPLQILYKCPSNLSWQYFDQLERHLQKANIIGIYDTYYFWNLQAAQAARRKNIPLFAEIWCTIPHHPSMFIPPYSWITKKVISQSTFFLARNHTSRNFLESLKVSPSKIHYSYMGIDLQHFSKKKQNESDQISILFVGNLIYEKGILDLLNAFAQLHKRYKNLKLIIAGQGPLQKKVLQAANVLPVEYKGFVPYSQLPALYHSSDILCAPSYTLQKFGITIWQEYFSYVLMEAQACGLPIVTTKSGGIPEEVPHQNIFISEHNIKQLRDGLEQLIIDESLRQKLGAINREHAVRSFELENQLAETTRIINKYI